MQVIITATQDKDDLRVAGQVFIFLGTKLNVATVIEVAR